MKKINLFTTFYLLSIFCFGQNPLVKQWDYRYGGGSEDWPFSIQPTFDGGYIIGGYSNSGITGDKTQNTQGALDYWIVKLDSLGLKQWDKDFGGTDGDLFTSLAPTRDGGYILGGYSISNSGGDKTQNMWGIEDYWIIKTDSLGNKEWDKDFGGYSYDQLFSIHQTSDGGFIFGGWSFSNIGGDKTQNTKGNTDYWIVKTDSLGIKEWDRDFGGSDDDQLFSVYQTRDGGYILGGWSNSPISGDKTQASWGGHDYWIIKTDSLGVKQWDKDFGGTDEDLFFSMQPTADGGYILGGYSFSTISGDKTQDTVGASDYWIVKTDSLGIKEWDKDFGGTYYEDDFVSVSQTLDKGFLISATSYSSMGGDKTENNLGAEQAWVIKTDSMGIKQWDKTALTTGHDEGGYSIQTKDGCYAFVSITDGGIGGEKTQLNRGAYDYWIIKFCEISQASFTAPNFLCSNTCVDFINNSINATSLQWSFPGGYPDTSTAIDPVNICYANPGNYDVQLIASNQYGSDTLLLSNYITVYPAPAQPTITQSGDTLFANTSYASYQWYFGSTLITGATNYFYFATMSGNYNLVVTDSFGCSVGVGIVNVMVGIPPNANVLENGIDIFPNPAKDEITVTLSEFQIGKLEIYNSLGEKIIEQPISSSCALQTADWSDGIYLVKISSAEKALSKKFVVLH